eukprot:INCI5733.1.p1 GENE.INCI5733.1~~INCI5733.1.p1  ORF type:complete len:620 (-),score=122.85 INCI5733.1:693-2468(-)
MARLPLSGTDSDDSFEIGSDNEDGGARGGAAEGNEGWDENMLNFEDNVDEYELEDLYGQAHRIRQRLFQAQQELAKAEEARQRAFRKVFSLRNELISCVNAEGGDVSTVDIVGGSAMIHKMPNTPLVAKATAQASAAATSLKAAASVASEQFPELSDALASAATVVEHAVEKRLGNRAKGRGSERDNLDSDQTNESGQENPSSGASTPADSSANGATNNNTTKQHVDTNVESEAADSEGSTATPTSGSGRRRSSATSRPRDSMLGDGLKIDSVTREIDADSLDTRIFRQGIILFNISARKGIDYMAHWGFLVKKPMLVAKFLQQTRGLNKAVVGDFLSKDRPFNAEVMHAYFEDLDLTDLRVDEALRVFVGSFRLSGEAGPINYMMEKFASLYNAHNPDWCSDNPDGTLLVAYAILMLNTSLHNPSVRPKDRMTLKGFQAQLRGQNIPPETLTEIFRHIKAKPFTLTQEQTEEPLQLLYPSYEGYADKTDWGSDGSQMAKSKRYFVLSDGILYYFNAQSDSTPSAAVLLNGCKVELSIDKQSLVIRHASGGPILVAKKFAWRPEFRFQLESAEDGLKWQSMIEKELQFTYT